MKSLFESINYLKFVSSATEAILSNAATRNLDGNAQLAINWIQAVTNLRAHESNAVLKDKMIRLAYVWQKKA